MAQETYEEGYRDGWEAVAGKEPMPAVMTFPPEGETKDYETGFQYGKSEAITRFTPGGGIVDPKPKGL